MTSATDSAPLPTAAPDGALWKFWLPIVLFGLLWADLVRQLGYHWDSDEQYAYGWFVPFLAIGLFWKRWVNRPVPQPSTAGFLLSAFCLLLCLLLLPVRVVYEINPDWLVPQWWMTGIVLALSMYAIFRMGGRSWFRHFAFPILFILVAVQWPYRIEHALTQGLMRVVANLTVELLGWIDIPALQRGNLIEVGTGVVGVDEACSGIRSFQSTLMAGLFLGELYRLCWPRRFLLLLCGVIVSFTFNIGRTLLLTWKASSDGVGAIQKWHDPAGLTIFFASFACLWALAIFLNRPGASNPDPRPLAPDSARLPGRFLVLVGCWSLIVLGLNEVWYRSHELKQSGLFHWSAGFPTNQPGFVEIPIEARTRKLLRHDIGITGKWTENDGTSWTSFFFRWNPTSVGAIISARQHRPDVCLPASGLRLVADAGTQIFSVGELRLPFRKYTYDSGGNLVHVFFCQWEDGTERQSGMWASMKTDRIRAALTGRRHLGQQSWEFVLSGYPSLEQAAAALQERLPGITRLAPHSAAP